MFAGEKAAWNLKDSKLMVAAKEVPQIKSNYHYCAVACNSGRCLYSCGPEGEDREADVEDAVEGSCPLSNVEGDLR